MVAGPAFILAHWGTGLLAPVRRIWPVQRPAVLVALAVAFGYAGLAGFPISTQRALIMLVVVMLCQILRRRSFSVGALVVGLVTVSIMDPLALLSAGFWLSFCAVGWLLFINTVQPPTNILRRLLQLHLYLALGLTPLLGALHQSVPLASPLANLVAVPIVSFAIVPLVMAGVVASPFDSSDRSDLVANGGLDLGMFMDVFVDTRTRARAGNRTSRAASMGCSLGPRWGHYVRRAVVIRSLATGNGIGRRLGARTAQYATVGTTTTNRS